MKHLLLIILIAISSSAFSQITITQSDVPNINDTIRYSTTNDMNDYVITDTAYTWDYSSLSSNGQGRYDYKSAIAINPLYILSFGLFGYGVKVSDGFSLGPISLSNIYNFYNKSATKYTIEGYGAEVSGIPLPSTYSDEDEFYQFPLDYGDMDTSTFSVKINIPTIGYLKFEGTRINIVEGYGTLITPYDTFNTIKVKTIVDEIDSLSTSFISFGFPRKTITYKWLCNTEKIPALEVTGIDIGGSFIPNQIRYRDQFRESAIPFRPFANYEASLTYCSMADTITLTNRSTPRLGSNTYLWDISPATFNYVAASTDASTSPKVVFNAPGLYTVKLSTTVAAVGTGGVALTDDSTSVDYILVRDFGNAVADVSSVEAIHVYPNPAQNMLQLDSKMDILSARIFDMQAKLIMDKQVLFNHTLDISQLAKGSYFVEFTNKAGKLYFCKFEKN